MTTRIGALFAGIGGLDLAALENLDGELAWVAENNAAAALVLASHWPDAPNLGDVSAVDWTNVDPVDVLTGGFPCQDVSAAGRRAGLRHGTRSGLWANMADAVAALRPRLVVIENVPGLLNAPAHSPMEPCPLCLGDRTDLALRALGAVLGDLADLRYDAEWTGIRASDVGAPHGRLRIFLLAWPRDLADPERIRRNPRRRDGSDDPPIEGTRGLPERPDRGGPPALLGTPRAAEWKGTGPVGSRSHAYRLDRSYLDAQALQIDADELADRWGKYAPAIQRWESVLRRPPPPPTEIGDKGSARLSARFVEWLMGLPDGWVTDVPGVNRTEQLRALGNAVVPQQASAALADLTRTEPAT